MHKQRWFLSFTKAECWLLVKWARLPRAKHTITKKLRGDPTGHVWQLIPSTVTIQIQSLTHPWGPKKTSTCCPWTWSYASRHPMRSCFQIQSFTHPWRDRRKSSTVKLLNVDEFLYCKPHFFPDVLRFDLMLCKKWTPHALMLSNPKFYPSMKRQKKIINSKGT